MLKVLFIGDIFGKSGRKAIQANLPKLIKSKKIDLVIANAENCSHGRSLTPKHYRFLKQAGIAVMTMGNHTWDKPEVLELLENNNDLIRPLNMANETPFNTGNGSIQLNVKNTKIRITNLIGKSIYSKRLKFTNPFLALQALIEKDDSDIHIVDFHAETTSEKNCLMHAFAGKVSAILGTHTHVQSADEKIYQDTAYITDVGMTGPAYGVIGADPKEIVDVAFEKYARYHIEPSSSKYQFCAVLLTFSNQHKIKKIERIYIYE